MGMPQHPHRVFAVFLQKSKYIHADHGDELPGRSGMYPCNHMGSMQTGSMCMNDKKFLFEEDCVWHALINTIRI